MNKELADYKEPIDYSKFITVKKTGDKIEVPETNLAKIRQAQADYNQFKSQVELQLQVKELILKNTIMETFLTMGLKLNDSIDLATGLAEIK